ncbi:MAG: argininosuccinate lyase [Clostridia bacterium]|nr:argininosuccinate lyase [Clostridia bacterium]
MAKMWAGRFSKELDAGVNDFNSSIRFDQAMYREDIEASIAHAGMLGACRILDAQDVALIQDGLHGILQDLDSGKLEFDPNAEDIHMFVEQVLTERIGAAGMRLHTARSRNDQVATDVRLYLKNRTREIQTAMDALLDVILKKAKEHTETVMPGFTHLQIAQPVTLAHHLMAYAQMFLRDKGRLADAVGRMDYSPLGSGALATTTYPIDRFLSAQLMGFSGVCENSMDAVSDRDFCVELNAALSLVMTHLSRLSEEIILWCSAQFHFIELDDAFATGSSIMPQKKNPDITELVRGKTGRVNGNLITLLTFLKGLPLAYNKDMQEDKEAIFDSIDTTLLCLKTMTPMLDTMRVLKEQMRASAATGFINATDCADYLTKKGVPFREAYHITGQLVRLCIDKGYTLETLPLEEYRSAHPLFDEDIYEAIDIGRCVAQRKVFGGPAPEAVREQIRRFEDAWKSRQG